MSRWDPDEDEVRDPRPYDYGSAKRAVAAASRHQYERQVAREEAVRAYAAAEARYRKALATKIVQLIDGGRAATVAQDLARGDERVSQLRYARDVAEGVRQIAEQAAWRETANRRSLDQLIEWSMRFAPDGEWPEGGVPGAR